MKELSQNEIKDAVATGEKVIPSREVPLRDRTTGHWQTILPILGIDAKFLKKKNGPCPMCGGKDRWRFYDPVGVGSWFCNNCGGGDGIALARKFTGLPFPELVKRIEEIIGDRPPAAVRPARTAVQNRAALNALWRHGRSIEPDDPVDRWLSGRGIDLREYPKCLRYIRQAKHADGTVHPAMLAMVSDPDGRPATLHKTYLTYEGGKAPVDRVRLFCPGPRPDGGAVRLADHGAELGIAEGIETSLAAAQLHGVPVWSALDAGGMEKFVPPLEVTRLIIFGDNDANCRGQQAAYNLAAKQSRKVAVDVRIPSQAGADWNDMLGVKP